MFECDNMNKTNNNRRYIYDIILLAVFIIIGIWGYLIINNHRSFGTYARLTCMTDSSEWSADVNLGIWGYYILQFDLDDDGDSISQVHLSRRYISSSLIPKNTYDTEYNLFYVHDGGVEVVQASCPDLICVYTKMATCTSDTIVCLPHKLIISVVDETTLNQDEDSGLDAVTW